MTCQSGHYVPVTSQVLPNHPGCPSPSHNHNQHPVRRSDRAVIAGLAAVADDAETGLYYPSLPRACEMQPPRFPPIRLYPVPVFARASTPVLVRWRLTGRYYDSPLPVLEELRSRQDQIHVHDTADLILYQNQEY